MNLQSVMNRRKEICAQSGRIVRIIEAEKAYTIYQLILNDPSLHLPLRVLAKKAGLNEFVLKRVFKLLFGNSIYQFRLETRFNAAKQKVLTSCFPIKDIAADFNFGNAEYFSRSFKKKFGKTPGQLRQQFPQSKSNNSKPGMEKDYKHLT